MNTRQYLEEAEAEYSASTLHEGSSKLAALKCILSYAPMENDLIIDREKAKGELKTAFSILKERDLYIVGIINHRDEWRLERKDLENEIVYRTIMKRKKISRAHAMLIHCTRSYKAGNVLYEMLSRFKIAAGKEEPLFPGDLVWSHYGLSIEYLEEVCKFVRYDEEKIIKIFSLLERSLIWHLGKMPFCSFKKFAKRLNTHDVVFSLVDNPDLYGKASEEVKRLPIRKIAAIVAARTINPLEDGFIIDLPGDQREKDLVKEVESRLEKDGRLSVMALARRAKQHVLWASAGFSRTPRRSDLAEAPVEVVKLLYNEKAFKFYQKIVSDRTYYNVGQADLDPHQNIAAMKIAAIFKGRSQEWLRGKNLHDAGINLPVKAQADIANWALEMNRRGYAASAIISSISILSAYAEKIGDWSHMTPKDVMDKAASLSIEGFYEAPEMAKECIKWGYKKEKIHSLIQRWNTRSTRRIIPNVTVVGEKGSKGYMLHPNDPRGLWAGEHTDCCQYPGGAASESAWHGALSKKGRIFVIENSAGKIRAQSWVWRRGSIICFDNIEALGSLRDSDFELYLKASQKLLSYNKITKVTVGKGCNDAPQIAYLKREKHPTSPPKGIYSDAKHQMILAEK